MLPVIWRKRENAWNPFREMETIQEEMNNLFNFSLGRFVDKKGGTLETSWSPAIDVVETKNNIRVLAEIPGLNKEDIKVSVHGDTLTIQGEKKQESETKEEGLIRTERMYGSFYRGLTLPQSVDSSNIKANYKNGVLELTLTKKEEAKPKEIDVRVE